MTEASSSPTPPLDDDAPWARTVAWSLLAKPAREDLGVLFRFVAAARAVADHPALENDRKEAVLAVLAAPFSADTVSVFAEDPWAVPAEALAALLKARGIDAHPAWQILQAAGQDLRKNRYRDWSDLLTWCRFAAAPVAVLAHALLGAGAARGDARRIESLGIAWQLIEITHRVQSHYRWLDRVYLPERWFVEARADMADLSFDCVSPALSVVLSRALDQAAALIGDGANSSARISDLRSRVALAALKIELRARIGKLRRADGFAPTLTPGAMVRKWIASRALFAAFCAKAREGMAGE